MPATQNIYDDPQFFAGYEGLRAAGNTIHGLLEQPAVRSLLPDLRDKRVLDIGCGAGEMTAWLAGRGAASVTGVDPSERMLEKARAHTARNISFIRSAAEDLEALPGSFDVVVSSLAFHYIADLPGLFKRIRTWMVGGGTLAFSTEHPVYTAAQGRRDGQWELDDQGRRAAWRVDDYFEESERVSTWFVEGVVRYHRKVATIINGLIDAGFSISRVLEPRASDEAVKENPEFLDERRRPMLLFASAIAIGGQNRNSPVQSENY